MASTTSAGETTRHLRSRDSGKKVSTDPAEAKSPTEEDAEMAAAATASHYLGCRGLSSKRKLQEGLITIHNTPKRPRSTHQTTDSSTGKVTEELTDVYCWECHRECVEGSLDCVSCPRTFHPDCLPSNSEASRESSSNWTCPVCLTIMKAECADSRSWAMQQVNIDQLCTLFGFALQRMKHPDSEAFHNPVPKSLLPDYYDVVFHPMDLSLLDKNIKRKLYASTEAFVEDAKWILHNSMIFNGSTSKYTADAKMIMKICKHEMAEIELCPDCYMNSCIRQENWFTEPCKSPHCLVWAKLKGFPYWPAKALRVSVSNNVDVRFFGAHDRAWVPLNQVYLLSEECPNPIKNVKKFGLDKAMEELTLHLKNLRGCPNVEFKYAPFKTEFKMEHLYNCSLLFSGSSQEENFTESEKNRMLHERRRVPSGDDNSSMGNSEDYSERSMNSFDKLDNSSSFVEPSVPIFIENPVTPNPVATSPIVEKPARKVMKAKKQISRPMATPAVEKSPDVTDSPNNGADPANAVDEEDEHMSVLEKIRLTMEHIDEENNEDSNFSNGESNAFCSITANGDANDGRAPSPDSTSPIMVADGEGLTPKSSQKLPIDETLMLDLDVNSVPVSNNTLSKPLSNSSASSSVVASISTVLQTEPTVKKRNLQSVLEKMHSNAHLNRSDSPSTNGDVVATGGDQHSSNFSMSTIPKSIKSTPTIKVDKSAFVEKYSEQINNFLHATIESMLDEIQQSSSDVSQEVPKISVRDAEHQNVSKEQLGKMRWFYQEAIRAMKNTAKVTFSELQQAVEAEKTATFEEARRKFDEELNTAVKEAKLKQWCANCGKEAVFYCCWNTSYCDYPCQQRHWPKHQANCAQIRQPGSDNNSVAALQHANQSFASVTSTLQFPATVTSAAATNGSATASVVPVYSLPAPPGYFKPSTLPTGSTVALDLNATNGQFLTLQSRPSGQMTVAPNVVARTIQRR